jgi:hypothetical protein
MTNQVPTADQLNNHLLKGGHVIISTYTKAWKYGRANAGMFYIGKDKELRVKRGNSSDCLTSGKGQRLLVSIKLY